MFESYVNQCVQHHQNIWEARVNDDVTLILCPICMIVHDVVETRIFVADFN